MEDKTMRKKIVCLLLAACMAVTALTGCGNGSAGTSGGGDDVSISDAEDTSAYLDPENPTTITFYSYSLATPSMKGGMEHLIDSFNETVGKEKGVVVESVADETYTKYMTDLQAGNQVDVVQMPFSLLDNGPYKGRVLTYHGGKTREYSIMSIPCVMVFKDGGLAGKNIGFAPKDAMKEFVEKNI